MSQGKNYLTEEKKQALEAELRELRGPKRKEILEALAYAKSLGDLAENAEYHQSREDQAKLEDHIARIEKILASSQIVKGGGGEIIDIGSKVTVEKIGTKEEKIYTIVGSLELESNNADGKISNQSPLGEALLGKKKGDTVSIKTPNSAVDYKVINVS